jgi:predicted nucleotide-binding protein
MIRMARNPAKPERHVLTVEQGRSCIARLQDCIRRLEDFDPQQVQKRFNIPEVVALEAAIDEALAVAFGHGSPSYDRYKRAASLDSGPRIGTARLSPTWGPGPQVDYEAQDAQDARRYLAEGKQQSIALLRTAIPALEQNIADQELFAQRFGGAAGTPEKGAPSRKVFIVHGHEGEPREAVAGFLRKIDFIPVILGEQTNQGRTIVEKFEDHSDVDFAVVLLTPDDVGGPKGGDQQPRARQNVILELGYFIGKLGRKNVCAIKLGDLEIPSDFIGVVWTPFDPHGGWMTALAKELRDAGHEIDWNKVMGP